MKPEMTKLASPEKKRRYIFPNKEFSPEDVVAVCPRPSGTHRLKTKDGKKFIVSPGWLAVELQTDAWTF